MGYWKVWKNGEVITTEKLNNIEENVRYAMKQAEDAKKVATGGVLDYDDLNNPPFGDIVVAREVLEETALVLQDGQVNAMVDYTFFPTLDGVYHVNWNGTDYETTAFEVDGGDGYLTIGLGNEKFFKPSADNGLPFSIIAVPNSVVEAAFYSWNLYVIAYDGTTSMTFSIVGAFNETKKIDPKYLPDDIGGGASSWNELEDKPFGEYQGEGYLMPETVAALMSEGMFVTYAPLSNPVVVGEKYTVTWNGTAYETTAQTFEENGVTIPVLGNFGAMTGGNDTGEPFVIMVANDAEIAAGFGGAYTMTYALDGSAALTLSIYGAGTFVKALDAKYLPEEVSDAARAAWVAKNDLVQTSDDGTWDTISVSANQTNAIVENADMAKALRKCAKAEFIDAGTEETYTLNKIQVDGMFYFGNLSIFEVGADTGEPFCFAVEFYGNAVGGKLKEAPTERVIYGLNRVYNERNMIPHAFLPPIYAEIPTTDPNITAALKVDQTNGFLRIILSNGTKYTVAITKET